MSTPPSPRSPAAISKPRGLVLDLDQTVVDSRVAKPLRSARQWGDVYQLIPHFTVIPGAETLLSAAMGLKVAVVTNSPSAYAERVLSYFKLRADTIVGYHDTALKKPYPDPVRLALNRMGIRATDVWAAGDHPDDIAAAVAAGIEITIGVTMASDDARGLGNAKPSMLVPDLTLVAEWISRLSR